MTLDDILDLVHRKAGDVDTAALRYQKNDLVKELAHVRRTMAVRKNAGMDGLSVTTTSGSEAISPEPTDNQGTLLALATAIAVLWRTYTARLDEGTLGITWQSGLESESTISAEKAYRLRVERLESEFEELLLITGSSTAGTRPQ